MTVSKKRTTLQIRLKDEFAQALNEGKTGPADLLNILGEPYGSRALHVSEFIEKTPAVAERNFQHLGTLNAMFRRLVIKATVFAADVAGFKSKDYAANPFFMMQILDHEVDAFLDEMEREVGYMVSGVHIPPSPNKVWPKQTPS